jgi:CubicO group peptidase (beta-lactamase class C family)
LAASRSASGIADPTRTLLELGQSGGQNPFTRRPVVGLLARTLGEADVVIANFPDLASFGVRMLHPGRTLIEKLLRVNNFVADEQRRARPQGWPRIGRQFYDIWALLGSTEVLDLLADRLRTAEIVADCTQVSQAFAPDLPPPVGGFGACAAFDPNWSEVARLRTEHETAMRDLYYGRRPGPTFDDVLGRVDQHRQLLDFCS